MIQVEQRMIQNDEGVGKISSYNDSGCSLKEGTVCFGYVDKIKNNLSVGYELPVGEVVSVETNNVVVLTRDGFRNMKRSVAEELSYRRSFIIKEFWDGYIGMYELLYYIQHINGRHSRFDTDEDLYSLTDKLKETLIKLIKPLDNKLFVKEYCPLYGDEEINISNLMEGKRYKKLVFVRFTGMVATRLFFPYISIEKMSKLWGYKTHATFYHAIKNLQHILLYEKNMSNILTTIFNDTLRQVQPSVYKQPALQLEKD